MGLNRRHRDGAHPISELFTAYVGTGQIAAMKAGEALVYERVLAKARQRGNSQAVRELEAIGAPPYDSWAEIDTQRKWALIFAGDGTGPGIFLLPLLIAPGYSLGDVCGLRERAAGEPGAFLRAMPWTDPC